MKKYLITGYDHSGKKIGVRLPASNFDEAIHWAIDHIEEITSVELLTRAEPDSADNLDGTEGSEAELYKIVGYDNFLRRVMVYVVVYSLSEANSFANNYMKEICSIEALALTDKSRIYSKLIIPYATIDRLKSIKK